jgi:hypothetical protein
MARGDAFVDAYILIPAGGSAEIRPANGVEIMIFHVMSGSATTNINTMGKDSSGNTTGYFAVGLEGGETSATDIVRIAYVYKTPKKFIITNTEFIAISNTASSSQSISIFGIETK